MEEQGIYVYVLNKCCENYFFSSWGQWKCNNTISISFQPILLWQLNIAIFICIVWHANNNKRIELSYVHMEYNYYTDKNSVIILINLKYCDVWSNQKDCKNKWSRNNKKMENSVEFHSFTNYKKCRTHFHVNLSLWEHRKCILLLRFQ